MYKQIKPFKTSIVRNDSYVGETIEEKINRITNNKEPITDGAPLIYTERKNGVMPEYDIRTDKWEVAVEAMDTVAKTHIAKREENIGSRTYDTMTDIERDNFHKKFPHNEKSKIAAAKQATQDQINQRS